MPHSHANTHALIKQMGNGRLNALIPTYSLHYLLRVSFNIPHSRTTQGHRHTQRKYIKAFACTLQPGDAKSKQADTWYQRARLRGECVQPLCRGGSVCGGRSCECVCWRARGERWRAAGSAATGPRGRLSRDTEDLSHNSAARNSRGLRSPSGHLKGEGEFKMWKIKKQ